MLCKPKTLVLIALLTLAELAVGGEIDRGFVGARFAGSKADGVTVVEVYPDSPAAKAKLQVDDRIIGMYEEAQDGNSRLDSLFESMLKKAESKIDEATLNRFFAVTPVSDVDSLATRINESPVGTTMAFDVIRNGKRVKIDVTLGTMPSFNPMLAQNDPPRVSGGTTQLANGGTFKGRQFTSAGNMIASSGVGYIDADFEQTWTGLLDVNLDKDAVFDVSGDVVLAGILHVKLSNTEPQSGNSFEIIRNARSIKGSFGKLMLPALKEGLHWKIVYDDVPAGTDLDQDGKHDVTLVVVEGRDDRVKTEE